MNYLLSVNGDDQRGLVESLASKIESLGGNWLQSRLCRLEGQFAGIVMVEFAASPEHLPEQVGSLSCRWKQVDPSGKPAVQGEEITLKILAADRPGIVKQLSEILATGGANVEEFESRVSSAPFSGEQMFEAHYRVSLDSGSDSNGLKSKLEDFAEELMCDLEFQES